MEFPSKLIEFVRLPKLKPSWAWDIRLWRLGSDYVINIVADLLRAQRNFGSMYHLDNIQKQFGWNIGVIENAARSGRFHAVSDMCDAVEALASNYSDLDVDEIRCAIMPKEGSPWDPKRESTSYYSVRYNKMIESTPPPQVVVDYYDGRMITGPVLDWCQIVPKVECDSQPNQIALTFTPHDRNEEIYIASHCFETLDGIRTALKKCGGLLFPSLSVGMLPSTNFGPLVLIADPALPLAGLKPYRTGKGEYPALVYPTDTWTIITNALYGFKGASALEEWTGRDFGNISNRFDLILSWTGSGGAHSAPPLKYTRQLLSRLNKLRRKYSDPGFDITSVGYGDKDYYPYAEAKINGITSLQCYTMAFCPVGVAEPFRRLLRRGGFRGSVFSVPGYRWEDVTDKDGRSSMTAQQQWDYGWAIRKMILRQISRKRHLLHFAGYA